MYNARGKEMKTIKAYEYKDLSKENREKVYSKWIDDEIMIQIQFLDNELNAGGISEEDYYKTLGCSKSYVESTAWFVPACYYEKHKKELEKVVKDGLKVSLFNVAGVFIQ